jgi:hypothetical protein
MRRTPAILLIAPAVLALWASFAPSQALAHGGGLDAAGCHHDRKRGGYHCHRAGYVRPAVPTTPSTAPRQFVPSAPSTDTTATRLADVPAYTEPATTSWQERDRRQREERARYWQDRGLSFDARYMSAYAMDQKARDIDRARFWNEKGYSFNPQYMSAYAMDQKVRDIERARFWSERGFTFNPEYMSAYAMDQKVRDIEHSKYWAARGFDFNPEYMSAYAMDREAERLRSRGLAQK